MKQTDFQDRVLQHLGADGEWKKNANSKFDIIIEQQKITNGTMRKHSEWIANINGKIAIMVGLVSFGATAFWQIIKNKFFS